MVITMLGKNFPYVPKDKDDKRLVIAMLDDKHGISCWCFTAVSMKYNHKTWFERLTKLVKEQNYRFFLPANWWKEVSEEFLLELGESSKLSIDN